MRHPRFHLASFPLFILISGLVFGVASAQGEKTFVEASLREPGPTPPVLAASMQKLLPKDMNRNEAEWLGAEESFEKDDASLSEASATPATPPASRALLDLIAEPIKTIPDPPLTCRKSEPTTRCLQKGDQKDPINLIFIGSADSLAYSFKQTHWTAMPTSFVKSLHYALTTFPKGWPKFPSMEKQFLSPNDIDIPRVQDLSYAKGKHWIRTLRREHFRLWEWDDTPDGQKVYVGMTNFDTHLKFVKHNILTHSIDSRIDIAREKIRKCLEKKNLVKSVGYITLPGAEKIDCATPGEKSPRYCTDGRTLVIELKEPPTNSRNPE